MIYHIFCKTYLKTSTKKIPTFSSSKLTKKIVNFLCKNFTFLLRKKLKCTIHTPILLLQYCILALFLLILHPIWKNKLLTF